MFKDKPARLKRIEQKRAAENERTRRQLFSQLEHLRNRRVIMEVDGLMVLDIPLWAVEHSPPDPTILNLAKGGQIQVRYL